MKLHEFTNIADSFSTSEKPPVLFIGHGNPMNVITENPYRKSWEDLGQATAKTERDIMRVRSLVYQRNFSGLTSFRPRSTISPVSPRSFSRSSIRRPAR